MVSQQPMIDANIGRICTMIRWCIEYQIGIIVKRYRLFENKIPCHMVPFIGSCLRYVISTHNHFQIGLIKCSEKRRKILTYIKMSMLSWWNKYPITKKEFDDVVLQTNSGDIQQSYFKLIKNMQDLNNVWSDNEIKNFALSDDDITIKGGGIGNFNKALQILHQSKNCIEMYVGTGKYKKYIMIRKIRMKMKVTSNKKANRKNSSIVLLKRVIAEQGLSDLKNGEFTFSDSMKQIAAYCDNIYGKRTLNFCSHSTAALLYYNIIIRNSLSLDPTPLITRYFCNIKNFGGWVGNMNGLNDVETTDYIRNIIDNNNFDNPHKDEYYGDIVEITNDSSSDDEYIDEYKMDV